MTTPPQLICAYAVTCANEAVATLPMPWGTIGICRRCLQLHRSFGGHHGGARCLVCDEPLPANAVMCEICASVG